MRKFSLVSLLVVASFLGGCASSIEKRDAVARLEAGKISDSREPFSSFQKFHWAEISYSAPVAANDSKKRYADQLGSLLKARMLPVLEYWEDQAPEGSRKLIIKPKVLSLRVISGGARFWAGSFAGDSFISLELEILDAETGQMVAAPVITKNSSALGGAWSIGATDRNLLNYVVDITHRYLLNNYQ